MQTGVLVFSMLNPEYENSTTIQSKPKGRKLIDGAGIRKLTNMQEKRNHLLKKLRSRVESPFGEIKQKWNSLSTCFKEDDE